MVWNSGTGLPSPYVAAIEEIISYFDGRMGVDALLLTGSWARGKGSEILGRPDLYTLFVQVVTLPKLDAQTLQEKTSLLFSALDKIDRER